MKIFMTGGTGFVGSYFTRRFTELKHEVTVLTRSMKGKTLHAGAEFLEGNPKESGPWQTRVAEHDVVINLAGTSIFTMWTARERESIMNSRVLTTRAVVDGLASGAGKPPLLISASAVGYYGGHEDDVVLYEDSPGGRDFLAEVSRNWEAEARRAETFGARVVITRFGIVLGRDGGALSKMVPAFKNYLGSALGSGEQWFPWVHQDDLFRIMLFLIEKEHIAGPVNATAPNPVRNKEMTRILADVLNKPLIMPRFPAFMLKSMLGEFGDVLLKGQRAIPKRLLDEGFQFQFPTFRQALEDLLR